MTRGSAAPIMHVATVSREFGIPAVVAVKRAARLTRTGDTVNVAGMTRRVRIE